MGTNMSKAPKTTFPILSGALALLLMHSHAFGSGESTSDPVVIENHMGLASSQGEIIAPQATNDEEAFLIRRIAEFWKDGDFTLVKKQIVSFFETYPDSALKEYFLGILGDLYLQENNPTLALEAYEQIHAPQIYDKILLNKLHCYYDLNQYQAIVEQGRPFLTKDTPEFAARRSELVFLVAEGLFRQGLALDDTQEDKETAYKEAKPLYEQLRDTNYGEVAKFALAETHRYLQNHEVAASLFLELAERYPEQRDDLYFQAANLQAHYEPTAAIGTFSQVIDNGGKRAEEAMFNRLILLFKTEQYSSVLSDYEKVASVVPESYVPTFKYIVGKSYYALEQYQDATKPLSEYISVTQEACDQLKNALLIQMTCAQKLVDQPLYAQSLESFEAYFPQDKELPKAVFLHGVMLKETGNLDLAKEKLENVLARFPGFENEEPFMFEYGFLAHENGEWEKAYNTFSNYFTMHPNSENILPAWKVFFSSALHRMEANDPAYSKAAFYKDIQTVLSKDGLFNEEETISYKLLHAKTQYELQQYPDAYDYITSVLATLDEEKHVKACAEAHYIAALSLYDQHKDHIDFCRHLEQAMRIDPETYDIGSSYVHLFNGYLIASGLNENTPEINSDLVDKAAENLFTATKLSDTDIRSENALWLANHYYQKVKSYVDEHWTHALSDREDIQEYAQRAETLFTKELLKDNTLVAIDANTLSFEPEVLKLAHLYDISGRKEKKLQLVSSLLEQQSNADSLTWQYKKHCLFELANTYKALGKADKAVETYNYISTFTTNLPTLMSNQAALQVARLQFAAIDAEHKTDKSDAVLSVLNQLKELQIRKNALSEPAHLEAALEYVTIRRDLAPQDIKNERQAFFYKRLKEDFESRSDTIGADYHATLEKTPAKHAMYAAYMKYVDAELLRLQAEGMLENDNRSDFEELCERSLSLFNEVKDDVSTPKELFEKSQQGIERINAINTY